MVAPLTLGQTPAPSRGARIAISSTPEDLEPYRAAAGDVARELGFEPLPLQHSADDDGDHVQDLAARSADADLLLAIVGWRRGAMPDPERGGDGQRAWTAWEVRTFLRRAKPVVVLMAGEGWPVEEREDDPAARAWLLDFRGDLSSLAAFFEPEPETAALAGFRERVRRELARHVPGAADGAPPEADAMAGRSELRLRPWPPPELPERPYPVLLPYTHPRLLAGRGRECRQLSRMLRLPVPILGLYSVSGAGKSSLVLGSLVPDLRAAGRQVAVVRHPAEPGLANRLIGDLLETGGEGALDPHDEDWRSFVERLRRVRTLSGAPPVLVVDQFEDLLSQRAGRAGRRRARAVAGMLLAASAQRQPGLEGLLCRWLLVYRQELHGEVVRWLGDSLREARSLGLIAAGILPHDLSGLDRFQTASLQPLGVPAAGSADPAAEAARVFRDVIEKPLAARGDDGTRLYPWTFAGDGAERLARAFGEARTAQPRAPLVPELQVVLAHLLERAVPPPGGGAAVVQVPEEPGELVSQALEEHLRRALDSAFPGRSEEARLGRTRALLTLCELADAGGQRGDGLAREELARAIGHEGREVLERLATPQTRLVVAERRGRDWIYVLSHDRMAEVLVRLVDEPRGQARLGIDGELLGLRRFVALKSELFAAGEVTQATVVTAKTFRSIERQCAALLWGEERKRWWQACRVRFRTERRSTWLRRAVAAVVVLVTIAGVWRGTDRRARRNALLQEVLQGEAEIAFAAADRLLVAWRAEPEELRAALRQRDEPLDLLERGIGGMAAGEGREGAVLRLAELTLPLITEDAPEDPVRIASLVWALDFFAPVDDRRREVRALALEPLRRSRPPPPLPEAADPAWALIPAGTFEMGSGPGEGRDDADKLDERPRHRVTLSSFRMGIHEVTNAEFRRLFPRPAEGRDDRLPATGMSWYQAYTYAAWLGGRLPTEAEAEYTRRAGCAFAYCKGDGSEASLDEVAWWLGNATDPVTGKLEIWPAGQLEPNPWGLFDVYGNVWEICADWYGPYPAEDRVDPPGPTRSSKNARVARGGSVAFTSEWITATGRGDLAIGARYLDYGLRVVLPGPVD